MSSVGNPPIISLLNSPSNLKYGLPDKSIETVHSASSMGSVNPYLSIPAYDETEKFGIIYTSKGGSSIIRGVLERNELLNIQLLHKNEWYSTYHYLLTPNRLDNINKIYTNLVNICEGKSSRDLVIVIRNPLYKWLSGIVADTGAKYFGEVSFNNVDLSLFANKVYEYLDSNLKKENSISFGHSALFNESHYNFLICNNINLNKLKIIDIDDSTSNLLKILQFYYPNIKEDDDTKSYWTLRGYHSMIIKTIIDKINSDNNKLLLNTVKRNIYNDYYYYNLLKSRFGQNFIKNT